MKTFEERVILDDHYFPCATKEDLDTILCCQLDYMRDRIEIKDFVTVNEIFDHIGAPRTREGLVYGYRNRDDFCWEIIEIDNGFIVKFKANRIY